jgi:REP element-mobilizing transposase RayT
MITYRLAWVIMPNHVHAIVEMENPAWGLSTVVQAWKSYTAKATNRVPGWDGLFWQPEYYDRAIRDVRHLAPAVAYGAESRGKSASGGNS